MKRNCWTKETFESSAGMGDCFDPDDTAGVGNLWLESQMWLFWWRHLARLIFS